MTLTQNRSRCAHIPILAVDSPILTGQSAVVADSTNYWLTAYAEPPLDRLERLPDGLVFAWLNREVPSIGSKVDWTRFTASRRHWFVSSAEELSAVVHEFLAALPAADHIDHGGDALSPFDVRIGGAEFASVIPVLLAIPEHHYFLATNRSWVAAFSMEGDVDLAFL